MMAGQEVQLTGGSLVVDRSPTVQDSSLVVAAIAGYLLTNSQSRESFIRDVTGALSEG